MTRDDGGRFVSKATVFQATSWLWFFETCDPKLHPEGYALDWTAGRLRGLGL